MGRSIAIDTETNGLFIKQGCKAFMATACDSEGELHKWEWNVNPFTREPDYQSPEAEETIKEMLNVICNYDTWVFHNSLFDMKALSSFPFRNLVGIDIEKLISDRTIHDTMVMAHSNRSLDRLGLKPLSFQYMDFPEEDQKELMECVTKGRRIAKKLGWATARADLDHPHLKPIKKDYAHCDYWVPGTLAKLHPDHLGKETTERFTNACSTYAYADVERTMGLYLHFRRQWATDYNYNIKRVKNYPDKNKAYEENRRCIIPIRRMMDRGMRLRIDKIPSMLKRLTDEKERIRKSLERLIPLSSGLRESGNFHFNPRSPVQLKEVLFKDFKIEPTIFSDAGNPKTDKDALNDILDNADLTKTSETFIKRLLAYRESNSMLNYLESYDRFKVKKGKHYYLYPNINPVGTTTTRVATREPNLQNVGKDKKDETLLDIRVSLREGFGPEKGKLWFAIDYSQLQLRIFAKVSGDKTLQAAFDAGEDIHNAVACKIFDTQNPTSIQRRAAKAINFGIIFGAGAKRITRECGIEGAYEEFKAQFPLVDRYLKKCERLVKKQGYVLTPGGYPLYVQKRTAYKGANFVIQGSEGEMVKRAAGYIEDLCYDNPSFPLVPIMTVHDEFILETKKKITLSRFNQKYPTAMKTIGDLMNQSAMEFGIKTEVDAKVITTHWADGKSYPLNQ